MYSMLQTTKGVRAGFEEALFSTALRAGIFAANYEARSIWNIKYYKVQPSTVMIFYLFIKQYVLFSITLSINQN